MNSYIIHPKNKTEENAAKAFLEALDIVFEKLNVPVKKQAAITINETPKIEPTKNLNSYAISDLKKDSHKKIVLPAPVKEILIKSIEQIDKGEFHTYEAVNQIIKNKLWK